MLRRELSDATRSRTEPVVPYSPTTKKKGLSVSAETSRPWLKRSKKAKAEETETQNLCQSLYDKLSTKITDAENKMPKLCEDSIKILRKKHADRTDIEVEKIFGELRKMPFFAALPVEQTSQEAWLELIKKADLIEDVTKGTHVVNADNALEALFVIISGEVKALDKHDRDAFDLKRRGDAFGELLPSKGVLWSRSVSISAEATALLRVDHYVSESVLRPLILKHQTARTAFLLSTRIFERWNEEDAREVADLMHERRYASNEVICKQGEGATELFIVVKGHCRVIKTVSVPAHTTANRSFQRAPNDVLDPVSGDMISSLQHLRQGRLFASRRHGVHKGGTSECAATHYHAEVPAMNQEARKQAAIQKRDRLVEAERKELQSVRGVYVPSLARLAARQSKLLQQRSPRPQGGGVHVRKNIVVQLRELWRGSFFGELSILNKEAKTASVVAATPVVVLVLGRIDLYRHFDDQMLAWMRVLGQDMEYAEEEEALEEALTLQNSWQEYRQATLSDSLFSRTLAEKQGLWFADRVIQDPSQPMGPLSRPKTGPNSRQIRAMQID